jgi:hypothetical protein
VIPLNSDADVVDFFNIVDSYKSKEVHLYVEHMVDDAIMVDEHLFLQVHEAQDGEGASGVDEISRATCEDGNGEGQDGECENSQSRNCKSSWVKTRVAYTVRSSKKRTSIANASSIEQASKQLTTSRGGI